MRDRQINHILHKRVGTDRIACANSSLTMATSSKCHHTWMYLVMFTSVGRSVMRNRRPLKSIAAGSGLLTVILPPSTAYRSIYR